MALIASKTFKMVLEGEGFEEGEFVDIGIPGYFLRRPLSVCDCEEGRMTLVYKVVGEGTKVLSEMPVGGELEVLTGLGKGFEPEACRERALLVGGGLGVPPLLLLAKRLKAQGKRVTAVLGFNKADEMILAEEFRAVCDEVLISTVDGSVGVKGFVTDAIAAGKPAFDYFYTCGPMVMMKVVCNTLEGPGEASLEERMGCGAGFCYGCSIQTKNGPRRVCKDGPVFKKEELIWGIRLRNPVVPASGTFGFGLELAGDMDLNVLGGISLKGTTREARYGNPTPRIAECDGGMINSVGLQNPGIDVLVGEKVPALRKVYDGCVIANISGFSLDEYVECCAKADACEGIDLIEVNVSCPNVHNGGMAFGTSAASAAEVTAAVKAVCRKPVFLKLSPNVTDIVSIARACEDAGADGLTLVNTFLGMRIDIARRKPVIANKMGGFSGRAIFPVALRMVYQVAHACRIPVMGCGGVASARDVVEMMMAGATAVQVGAENLRNPFACPEIVDELPALMEELGINTLQEIIGTV